MSFDVEGFERAGRANGPIGEAADQADPCPDQPAGVVGAAILSAGAVAVGKEVGLSIHEVRELAEACNRLVLADGEDPTGMNGPQTVCAVGMFWGVLHMLRLDQEANADGLALDAEDAKMLISFIGHEVGFGALQELGTVGKLRRLANA